MISFSTLGRGRFISIPAPLPKCFLVEKLKKIKKIYTNTKRAEVSFLRGSYYKHDQDTYQNQVISTYFFGPRTCFYKSNTMKVIKRTGYSTGA